MRACTIEKNAAACNCSYPCDRKGLCCECIAFHRSSGELPACYFDARTERSYDRSIENYLGTRKAP